ncbi:3BP5L protein, partial [Turnix velox]|nr:3BP5L protein [Turnix velox]
TTSSLGTPGGDTLSLLSLQTITSDLHKMDSVEHLLAFSDASSLNSQGEEVLGGRRRREEGEGGGGGRGGGRFKHHRSLSL